MASIYNVDEETGAGEPKKLPSVEHDIRFAKKFLQRHSQESGDCLYDHLVELLEKILSERPRNAVDIFEDYSRKIKDQRFKSKTNYLRDLYEPPAQLEEAKKFIQLYQALKNESEDGVNDEPEEEEKNDDSKRATPDIMELFFHLEQIDVALPRYKMVALNLSIRKLVADKPIKNVRFWGKIIGRPKNYYIVEAELVPEELLARQSVETNENQEDMANGVNVEKLDELDEEREIEQRDTTVTENDIAKVDEESMNKLQLIFPPLPKNLWKAAPIVPIETIGIGLNKNVYYVCNSPGIDDWMELPLVTPQQIVAARQIVRLCTGDPEAPIYTFPPFPGTEKNYLRAQIARISATTLVSPIGFFTFGSESLDEEDEDDAATEMAGEEDEDGTISKNRHYEPLPMKELIDPSMSNWCHHSPYILPQGRTVWWDPRKNISRGDDDETDVEEAEEEEEEEDDDDDERENNEGDDSVAEFRKQVGPPLLTPLSEDGSLDSIVAWTARASSPIKSHGGIAIVRSNIWPGSFAFAKGKQFANVYIGTGQKFNPYNYSPPGMPMIQEQYKIGPEVMEIQDPSYEEEEAYRIAHLPPSKPVPLELGGEQGEQTDEEEDDDDYDDDDDED